MSRPSTRPLPPARAPQRPPEPSAGRFAAHVLELLLARRLRRPLIVAVAALALTACAATAVSLVDGGRPVAGEGTTTLVGRFAWTSEQPEFGGLSALELGPDGLDLLALGDRAVTLRGRLARDARGAVTGVEAAAPSEVAGETDRTLADRGADSEGLAVDAQGHPWGATFASFEGVPLVRRLGGAGEPATVLPAAPAWADLPVNRALEALAVDGAGALYAIPEAPDEGDAFPVYRLPPGGDAWEVAFRIPRRDGFRPTGADIGPDDRLTVVERHFSGVAFRSRLRRFDLDGGGEATLWTSGPGEFDNLEGVAVWRDETGAHGGGLRATLVSDDNFRFFQQTLLVDLRLPD